MQLGTQVLIFLTSLESREGDYVCFNVRLTTAVPRYGYSYARHCHLCTLRTWVREGRPGVGGAVQGRCHHTNVDIAASSVVD